MFFQQTYIVSEAESAAWHRQYGGDTASAGMKREMSIVQVEEAISTIVGRQMEEDPSADVVDSGILLSVLSDGGFDGALEMRLEGLVEARFAEEKSRRAINP